MAQKEIFIEVKDPLQILDEDPSELKKPDEKGVEYVDLSKPEEAVQAAKPAETKPVADKVAPVLAQDDDVPEDLRGKTTSQLAKMYAEARSTIGRQGKDLGDLRKLADRYIQAGLQAAIAAKTPAAAAVEAPKPKTKEERDVEFFASPSEAMAKAVEEHPAVKEAREATQRMIEERKIDTALRTKAAFHTAYPKALEVVADPAFQQWIEASKVRTALLHHADKSYDLDAAHEIFGGWEVAKAAKAPRTAAAPAKSTPVREPAAGGVPTGGNAGMSGAPGGGGKIYRRADIMDMMVNRPKEYQERTDEIQRAYAERRVR